MKILPTTNCRRAHPRNISRQTNLRAYAKLAPAHLRCRQSNGTVPPTEKFLRPDSRSIIKDRPDRQGRHRPNSGIEPRPISRKICETCTSICVHLRATGHGRQHLRGRKNVKHTPLTTFIIESLSSPYVVRTCCRSPLAAKPVLPSRVAASSVAPKMGIWVSSRVASSTTAADRRH